MLQPMRTKFRKAHKGVSRALRPRASDLAFGQFGSRRSSRSALPRAQIGAARRALTRHMKRAAGSGSASIRICRVEEASSKVRMGSGKARRNSGSCGSSLGESCSR